MREVTRVPAAFSPRAAVGFAAAATVVVAVGMDMLAGEHPLHSATVGLIALVVAAMRMRSPGHWRHHVDALSGAIVAQPALHAASKLLPVTPDPVNGHVAESSVSAAHVVLAMMVVAFVSGAERLFRAITAVRPLATLLRLLVPLPTPRGPVTRSRPHHAVQLIARLVVADVSLRGPPHEPIAAV